MKYLVAAALALAAGAGMAQGLEARDINGDGTVDAYYEASSNLTWLADANLAASAGLGNWAYGPGALTNNEAVTFLGGLDLFGVTGWRLPAAVFTATAQTNGDCEAFFTRSPIAGCTYAADPEHNELAHLFQTIGAGASPFLNVMGGYWLPNLGLASPVSTLPIAHYFRPGTGEAQASPVSNYAFAWGVREGDVIAAAPIPEPSTYALLSLGLLAVVARARRRGK